MSSEKKYLKKMEIFCKFSCKINFLFKSTFGDILVLKKKKQQYNENIILFMTQKYMPLNTFACITEHCPNSLKQELKF